MAGRFSVRAPVKLRGGSVVPWWTVLVFPVLLLSVRLLAAHRTRLSVAVGVAGMLAVAAAALWVRRSWVCGVRRSGGLGRPSR